MHRKKYLFILILFSGLNSSCADKKQEVELKEVLVAAQPMAEAPPAVAMLIQRNNFVGHGTQITIEIPGLTEELRRIRSTMEDSNPNSIGGLCSRYWFSLSLITFTLSVAKCCFAK